MARGRPKKIVGARDQRLDIRVTAEEKKALLEAASYFGVSVTAYLLGRALGDRLGGVIKGEGFTPSSSVPKQKKSE